MLGNAGAVVCIDDRRDVCVTSSRRLGCPSSVVGVVVKQREAHRPANDVSASPRMQVNFPAATLAPFDRTSDVADEKHVDASLHVVHVSSHGRNMESSMKKLSTLHVGILSLLTVLFNSDE